jgi:hypothetical protein
VLAPKKPAFCGLFCVGWPLHRKHGALAHRQIHNTPGPARVVVRRNLLRRNDQKKKIASEDF